MTPDDLIERVAQAVCKADGNDWSDNKEAGRVLYRHEARAAIAIALKEAAQVAEAKSDEWATEWRKGLKCDSHLEGMTDGADEVAAAIRAMIKEGSND